MEYFGAKNLQYIGNLKYSMNAANINKDLVDEVGKNIEKRIVIFIASTHPGEEAMILKRIRPLIENNPDVLIFLAPRHPARTEEVKNLIDEFGFRYEQRSKTTKINKSTQLYLIDTLGEMNNFFKLSNITIMGGSFVANINGHNIIEPAKFENAIVCGPHMSNFKQALDEFIKAKAIIQVSEEELFSAVERLLSDSKLLKSNEVNAHKIAFSYEQILPKTVELLLLELRK